jgi:hypothetical protein
MEMTLLASSRWFVAVCAALVLSFPSSAFVYSSDRVRVRVVDEGLGKPIPSVIGVAIWIVEYPSFVTGRVHRPVAVEEAVSDAEGWIEFPAWKTERPFEASYTSNAPRILLYHEEYRPMFLVNEITMERNVVQPALSRWNGKEVRLEQARVGLKERAIDLIAIDSRLPEPKDDPDQPCWFERFPRLLAALDQMDGKFRQSAIMVSTRAAFFRANERSLLARGCRRVSDVIEQGADK